MSQESSPAAKKPKVEQQDSSDEDEVEPECFIKMLPDDILMEIFDWLYYEERKTCTLVCHRWLSVLRTSYYMSRTTYIMAHAFGYLISPAEQRLISNCGHIYFNDCGSLPGFVCDNLVPAHKRQDQPGPSTARVGISLEDFLFSGELQVRKFTLTAVCARIMIHAAKRLKMMADLEEFAINILPPQEEQYVQKIEGTEPKWTLEHPKVRSFTILLYGEPMPYELVMPQLTKLNTEFLTDNELRVVERYCNQLEELEVMIYFSRGMEQITTYSFPKLKKLNLRRFDINDIPDPNTPVDDASTERFINGAPLLEDVTLRRNVVTARMLRAVCVVGERSVTRLTITECTLPGRLFGFIRELNKLEFLKLKHCALEENDRPLREVDFPRLKELILINSGTCIRIDDGLSTVTHFKYTVDPKLPKVCRYMWQLEDFEIKLRTKYPVAEYVRDHFHTLPGLTQLRTLRLSGMLTLNRPWDFCRPMPAVQRLVLRKCHLVRGEFSKLPKLFPSLRVLELNQTHIAYKRCPDGVNPLVHFTARLKQFFPACRIVVTPKSFATPLTTVLEMEKEFWWHYNHGRTVKIPAGMRIEPLCPKMKAKIEARRLRSKQRKAEQAERERQLEQENLDDSE